MEKGNGDQGKGSYKRFDEYVEDVVNNTDHASELIARSFYKILRKNGFSNSNIINTANNILDCLIKSLDGYKEKIGVPTDAETTAETTAEIDDETDKINIHVQ